MEKTFIKMSKASIVFFVLLLLNGCAAYSPTMIDGSYKSTISDLELKDKVTVVASFWGLKQLDKLGEEKPRRLKSDQRLAKNIVVGSLAELCNRDQKCFSNYIVTLDKNSVNTGTYIDLRIHSYVNWWPVLLTIVPTYYSTNASYCITADVYVDGEKKDRFEEWGFVKESGIWFMQLPENPKGVLLRNFLVKKVLNESISTLG